MDFGRAIMWAVGAGLVVIGLFMLLVETGASAYIPAGILVAGIVLILGLVVMGMANRTEREPAHQEVHTHAGESRPATEEKKGGTQIIKVE